MSIRNPRTIALGLFAVTVLALFSTNLIDFHSGPRPQPKPAFPGSGDDFLNFIAQLVLSTVLLVAALYVILTRKYKPEDKNWAYGALGTIAGFWLHG